MHRSDWVRGERCPGAFSPFWERFGKENYSNNADSSIANSALGSRYWMPESMAPNSTIEMHRISCHWIDL